MIQFKNLSNETPFLVFKDKYDEAIEAGQKNIEAVSISSYDKVKEEVDSRFVNMKFLQNDKFIFFTNYNSPKSAAFKSHNQISGLFYWSKINVQIRMKAKIKETPIKYNKDYFKTRSLEKNALAISSMQSELIHSYDEVLKKYKKTFENDNLLECPKYWGGFSFKPYEIEFWEGSDFRLNKRNLYKLENACWNHFILQP